MPDLKRKRILYYCQSLVGIGHLTCSLRIIEELLPHCDVDLIHGGLDGGAVPVRPGFRSLRLATLLHDEYSGEFFDPESRRGIDEIWADRAQAIGGFLRLPYHAVMLEFYPFGRRRFKREIMGLLGIAVQQQHRPGMRVQIRAVGQVEAFALQPAHHVAVPPGVADLVHIGVRLKVGEELAGTHADRGLRVLRIGRIRAVERHLRRPLAPAAAPLVERLPAPGVVCLVGRDAQLLQQVGVPAVVANDEQDVALRPAVAGGEPHEVHAALPVVGVVRRRGGQRERVHPGAVRQVRENLVVVASPALIAPQRSLKASSLRRHVLLQQSTRPYAWRHWFASLQMEVENDMLGPRLELFSMLAEAAIQGLGVALIPRFLIEEELGTGRLIEVVRHAYLSDRSYYLLYPERKSENVTLAVFRDWLIEEARRYREAAGLA